MTAAYALVILVGALLGVGLGLLGVGSRDSNPDAWLVGVVLLLGAALVAFLAWGPA